MNMCVCDFFSFLVRCALGVHVCMCRVCVRSLEVTQKAAWVVMNCIDFRAPVECLFRSDIIRTEKLYKIAVVLTIKIKKYLCTHCYCCSPITAPLRASKCSKFGKVWLWSQLPHNTWSLVSQRTGGMKEKKEWKKYTLFHNQPFSLRLVFFSLCQEVLSLGI